MVTLYENGILGQLRSLVKNRTNPYVCVSEKIGDIDPLYFFYLGEEFSFEHRFYWSDPLNKTVYVGLGCSYSIETTQAVGRFLNIESEWKRFTAQVTINERQDGMRFGPVLFGGFSFDPLKRKTERWGCFPEGKFIVPILLLAVIEGNTWLTITVPTDYHEENITRIEQLLAALQHDKDLPYALNAKCVKALEVEKEAWIAAVSKATSDIQSAKLEKVVLAREMRLLFDRKISPSIVLGRLREQQPYSYIFALQNGNDCFLGASPEQLVKKEGNVCYSTCLAGSIRRGKTLKEDEELGRWLLQDGKNLQEHRFVVEMIRKAMIDVCEEVVIPDTPSLLKVRDIQHLYTPVKGINRRPVSLFSLVESLHPTPALGGTPRETAIEKIREIEPLDRGWYAAPIGWIDMTGDGEFAVAIRSGLIQGKEASIFAGCGVVGSSNIESEYEETKVKFRPMLSALGREEIE